MNKINWQDMAKKATEIWTKRGLLPKQSAGYRFGTYHEPGRIYDEIHWIGSTIDFSPGADLDKDSRFYICNSKWIDIELDTKFVLNEIYNESVDEQEKEKIASYLCGNK